MTTAEKVKSLMAIRQTLSTLEEKYKAEVEPFKAQRDALQAELIEAMKNEGEFSKRYDFATISRSVRPKFKVINEAQVIESLKKLELDNEYVAPRLNQTFYDILPALIKEETKLDGIQTTETEFLSIRKAEEGTEKRKIVTN